MIRARIAKRFPRGPESAEFSLDVEFEAGPGVTVLFGASGAGKTLTLDCIAGFEKPDSGRILIADSIVFDAGARVSVRPQERRCGYVFQNYALFPHMTLRANLEFAAGRQGRLERRRKIGEMLDRFHLADIAGRYPHELSGGQKQRCSIARALIASPRVLLLDEPARGLDAPLRRELYALLRELRGEFRIPMLLVTHDLEECFAAGEVMLLYHEGRIVQSGSPAKVLERPANLEVARLLGLSNCFEAEIVTLDPGRNASRLRLREREISGLYYPGKFRGDRVWVCVRARELRVGAEPGPNRLPAHLRRAIEMPESMRLEFAGEITVELSHEEYARQRDNKEWFVEFPAESLKVIG